MPYIVWNKKRLIEDWKIEPKDDFFGSFRQASSQVWIFIIRNWSINKHSPKHVFQSKNKTYIDIKKNTVEPLVSEHPKCKD